MVVEVIRREIAETGTGRIILRDCPEGRIGEGLGKGMDRLRRAGAKRVLAVSLPEGEPLHAGPVGVWRLTEAYQLLRMTRATANAPKPALRIATKPLKKALDDKNWVDLMAQAFCDVLGTSAPSPTNLHRLGRRCGLGWLGDQFVGAYEVDVSEKTPELVSLAISPAFRGQGYGRALLLTLLDGMRRMGRCELQVSSLNAPALALFTSVGFETTQILETWFQVL